MTKYIPLGIKKKIAPFAIRLRIILSRFYHLKSRLRITSNKKKIRVAFLLVNESIWKYERLYFLLKNDSRFDPVVFICPFLTYGPDVMKQEMENAFRSFKAKKYHVVKTLNDDGTYLDINKDFKPDLVFFCTPWPHSLPQYHIRSFMHILTCYVHYGFNTVANHYFNMETTLLSWRVFVETEYHKKSAIKMSINKGKNFVVSGYTGIDSLIDENYSYKQVWKYQEVSKKKIIWAPHHSIEGVKGRNVFHSTFLQYARLMLDIAKKYQDKIQISFKPHPNLKGKLYILWGKDKTDRYYNEWTCIANGQLDDGDYIDLFLGSDAMIHDSSSFLIEYLYTKKPVLFLADDLNVEMLNEIGVEALENIEKAYSEDEIVTFIDNVVLNNIDSYKFKREKFVNEILMPPNNILASENIYNYIKRQLNYN